jgi:hypothetical protein
MSAAASLRKVNENFSGHGTVRAENFNHTIIRAGDGPLFCSWKGRTGLERVKITLAMQTLPGQSDMDWDIIPARIFPCVCEVFPLCFQGTRLNQ